jgi:hypothetical protein
MANQSKSSAKVPMSTINIDVRLQGVEKRVGNFDEIKTIITSLSSRVVSVEKNIINCQAKITEVENSVQGVGNYKPVNIRLFFMDRHWRSRIEFCRVFICPWQLHWLLELT